MKLKNSTDFSEAFLRRMVSWCCRAVGLPVRWLRRATFKKTRTTYRNIAFSGLGGGCSIIVRIGSDSAYPVREFIRHGVKHPSHADRVEGLVSTTAHECYHCRQSRDRAWRGRYNDEAAAIQAESVALESFRANRDALMADWSRPVRQKKQVPAISLSAKRAVKALVDLARWERKLAIAKGKVAKYRKRVHYYERSAALASPIGQDSQPELGVLAIPSLPANSEPSCFS